VQRDGWLSVEGCVIVGGAPAYYNSILGSNPDIPQITINVPVL
jgi:hypothetical protein